MVILRVVECWMVRCMSSYECYWIGRSSVHQSPVTSRVESRHIWNIAIVYGHLQSWRHRSLIFICVGKTQHDEIGNSDSRFYASVRSRRRRIVLRTVAAAVVDTVHAPPAMTFLHAEQFQMPTARRFTLSLPQNVQVYRACWVISIFLTCLRREAP